MVNKKTIITLLLLIVLALPVSAFAESFTVTTNKDIYTPDEKAIIVGTIPADAPTGYAVLIKVTGPRGDCAVTNILPAADNSFISRPVRLDECGFGEFTVLAFYADQKTNSTFAISSSSQADVGAKLELRVLKNVILQAQDVVNTRVKELVEKGYVLPEEVADKYSEGVSKASLALQAIEFGDAAQAKKHMIFALQDFRKVLNALSDENVARFEQTVEQQTANYGNLDVVGTYRMLLAYYYRLEELAGKNQVDKVGEFGAASLLLSNTKRMIDEGNYENAGRNLERVNAILEEIRANLFDEDEGKNEEKFTSETNSTSQVDEKLARKLTDTAARYEKNALELLNKTGSDTEAGAKVQEALALIASARTSIEAQDLESARDDLSAAYYAINDARKLIENDDGGNTSTSSRGENSDNGSSNDGSKDSDDSGNDNENNKGTGNDKDDQ